MPTLFLASVVVALFLAVATPAAQQGTSEIRGRVVDQTGAVLPGVTVVLTNEDTGVFRETISGADGSYFATQLHSRSLPHPRETQRLPEARAAGIGAAAWHHADHQSDARGWTA